MACFLQLSRVGRNHLVQFGTFLRRGGGIDRQQFSQSRNYTLPSKPEHFLRKCAAIAYVRRSPTPPAGSHSASCGRVVQPTSRSISANCGRSKPPLHLSQCPFRPAGLYPAAGWEPHFGASVGHPRRATDQGHALILQLGATQNYESSSLRSGPR